MFNFAQIKIAVIIKSEKSRIIITVKIKCHSGKAERNWRVKNNANAIPWDGESIFKWKCCRCEEGETKIVLSSHRTASWAT